MMFPCLMSQIYCCHVRCPVMMPTFSLVSTPSGQSMMNSLKRNTLTLSDSNDCHLYLLTIAIFVLGYSMMNSLKRKALSLFNDTNNCILPCTCCLTSTTLLCRTPRMQCSSPKRSRPHPPELIHLMANAFWFHSIFQDLKCKWKCTFIPFNKLADTWHWRSFPSCH